MSKQKIAPLPLEDDYNDTDNDTSSSSSNNSYESTVISLNCFKSARENEDHLDKVREYLGGYKIFVD